jgi:hypothetical protein
MLANRQIIAGNPFIPTYEIAFVISILTKGVSIPAAIKNTIEINFIAKSFNY